MKCLRSSPTSHSSVVSKGQHSTSPSQKADDPYFYDIEDSIGPHIAIEEKLAYDNAVSAGAAALSLEAWSSARRNEHMKLSDIATRLVPGKRIRLCAAAMPSSQLSRRAALEFSRELRDECVPTVPPACSRYRHYLPPACAAVVEALSCKAVLEAELQMEALAKEVMRDNYELGQLMLKSAELGSATTTARVLIAMESLCPASAVQVVIRDLYVRQVGVGLDTKKDVFDACLRDHVGPTPPVNLRAKLFLAKHHIGVDKLAKARRQRSKHV